MRGRVVDEDCQPVANANVEIWQACATGRYNNRNDPNPAALDPNFRYWAEAFTVADGLYQFIKPLFPVPTQPMKVGRALRTFTFG